MLFLFSSSLRREKNDVYFSVEKCYRDGVGFHVFRGNHLCLSFRLLVTRLLVSLGRVVRFDFVAFRVCVVYPMVVI